MVRKKYTAAQNKAMREPVHIKADRWSQGENWFYVGQGRCSFHNGLLNGEGVYVPTRQLIKALKEAGLI